MVLPWLEAVERRADGRETVADLRKWLDVGQLQLYCWMEEDDSVTGVLVTEIVQMARGKICRFRVCTGRNPERWMPSVKIIEDWARANGCIAMEPIARMGWKKYLEPLGYQATHYVFEKKL